MYHLNHPCHKVTFTFVNDLKYKLILELFNTSYSFIFILLFK